jgi:hypothetical protein
MPFGPCPKHGFFQNSWGFGVGGEVMMLRHALESEFGRKRGGDGNIC